jgi:NAD+ diphosphatase
LSDPGPPLSAGGFDRAAHRRRDAGWLATAWDRAGVVVVEHGRVLIRHNALVLVDPADAPEGERYFLGIGAGEEAYFAVAGDLPAVPGATGASLREIVTALPERDAGLFVTAVALVNWHARHRYSPLTGAVTTAAEGGWTRVTDDGAETLWPRTDPAVIVLVHDAVAGPAGRCLLGHNAAWTGPTWENRYSCLAGFVEPGESAEATVVREIAEEVGVVVRDARYVASQSWPFPGSLMLGFQAVGDPDAPLRLDQEEITAARWFTRAQVRAALAGREAEFVPPPAASIARHLIEVWAQLP